MQLPQSDVELFFKLFQHLLVFSNNQKKVGTPLQSREDLFKLDLQEIFKIRNVLFPNIHLIDDFVEQNPFHFPERELSHVLKWKKFKMGKYTIMAFLKDCTVFYGGSGDDEDKPYGVMSLNSRFDDMIDKSQLPLMIEVNLLPFKDHIITDGLFQPYNIAFGASMTRSMKQEYAKAKARFGIIKSFDESSKGVSEQQQDMLKMYLKTPKSRAYYEEEITQLLKAHPHLQKIYIQEMGKKYVRKQKKCLESYGFTGCYMAAFGESIIASGKTKKMLKNNLKGILPEEKEDWVTIFSLKKS